MATIDEIYNQIKSSLDSSSQKVHISTVYAFNWTWKTRLSKKFLDLNDNEDGIQKVLCYNAFLEDNFSWDNEEKKLIFNPSWEMTLIKDEWIDSDVIDHFKNIWRTKLEPKFSSDYENISFSYPWEPENPEESIKISRWEESLFIRSLFFSILENAVNQLNMEYSDRSTHIFDNLEYIIIDDPVSSIDDTNIIKVAIDFIGLIKKISNNNIKFLITTHHALFYNVLYHEFCNNSDFKYKWYVIEKEWNDLLLKSLTSWSPFWYHLVVINEIERAINDDSIQRYHFDLFRWLLEKTANFLWIKNRFYCLKEENRNEFTRLLNLYSHNTLEPMESNYLPGEQKTFFKEIFNDFINEYKFVINN